jgi:hypothetical protein
MIGTGDDVEKCFEEARKDIVVDQVNDLTDANLMILWVAATSKVDLAKDIYRRYSRFSRDRENSHCSTSSRNLLSPCVVAVDGNC